jgi:hypothetical protein
MLLRRLWGRRCVPAGSFRWDRFVRSSLASSMAGFISGGRLSSLPVWMADSVVTTVFFCRGIVSCALPRGPVCWAWAYLAILELKHQRHLVALDLLVDDLGGDPAVGRVRLPCPGAVLVDVCHDGGRVPRPLVRRWE